MELQQTSYTFSEDDAGAEVCLLASGFVQTGQTFRIGYLTLGGTASESRSCLLIPSQNSDLKLGLEFGYKVGHLTLL